MFGGDRGQNASPVKSQYSYKSRKDASDKGQRITQLQLPQLQQVNIIANQSQASFHSTVRSKKSFRSSGSNLKGSQKPSTIHPSGKSALPKLPNLNLSDVRSNRSFTSQKQSTFNNPSQAMNRGELELAPPAEPKKYVKIQLYQDHDKLPVYEMRWPKTGTVELVTIN
jgi:hypothetical protein